MSRYIDVDKLSEMIEKLGNLADMLTKGVTSDHPTEKGGVQE